MEQNKENYEDKLFEQRKNEQLSLKFDKSILARMYNNDIDLFREMCIERKEKNLGFKDTSETNLKKALFAIYENTGGGGLSNKDSKYPEERIMYYIEQALEEFKPIKIWKIPIIASNESVSGKVFELKENSEIYNIIFELNNGIIPNKIKFL